MAAPALDRAVRGRHDQHLPAVHGPVHQRAAGGAGQRQRDAGGRQGALVLRGPPGAARVLPSDRGGRPRAHGHPRGRGARAVRRPGPRGDGGSPRPSDRKAGVLLFTFVCGAGLAITFLGAFFRGPGYAWTLPWQGLYFAL
ncbi:MAG: hypothetical protein R3C32_05410 [Chloroflexota bacterium]